MKGLLLKDLINLGKQTRTLLIVFFFYLVFAFFAENSAVYGGIVSIMLVMLVITSMAYDERSNWDRYALTMPVSRDQIILSKYLLGLILSGFGLVVNILLLSLTNQMAFGEVLLLAFSLFAVGMVFLAVLLPLMVQFGVERGRMLMIVVLFLPTAVILILSKVGVQPPGEAFIQALPWIIPAILILTIGLSIVISLQIFRQKEL